MILTNVFRSDRFFFAREREHAGSPNESDKTSRALYLSRLIGLSYSGHGKLVVSILPFTGTALRSNSRYGNGVHFGSHNGGVISLVASRAVKSRQVHATSGVASRNCRVARQPRFKRTLRDPIANCLERQKEERISIAAGFCITVSRRA